MELYCILILIPDLRSNFRLLEFLGTDLQPFLIWVDLFQLFRCGLHSRVNQMCLFKYISVIKWFALRAPDVQTLIKWFALRAPEVQTLIKWFALRAPEVQTLINDLRCASRSSDLNQMICAARSRSSDLNQMICAARSRSSDLNQLFALRAPDVQTLINKQTI